jgi:hypothetical protein
MKKNLMVPGSVLSTKMKYIEKFKRKKKKRELLCEPASCAEVFQHQGSRPVWLI